MCPQLLRGEQSGGEGLGAARTVQGAWDQEGLAWGGALGKEATCETVATPIYICCMFLLYKDNHSPFSVFSEGTLVVSVPNSFFGG